MNLNPIPAVTHFFTTLVKHNPKTIKRIEVVVSAEIPVVKEALEVVLDAYLATKGIVPGSLPELAANAALDLIAAALDNQANATVISNTIVSV